MPALALTVVAKALVRAARAILKVKGLKGLVGMSPEGVKKATGIIARSGQREAIQSLVARSPSNVNVRTIRDLLGGSRSLSREAVEK